MLLLDTDWTYLIWSYLLYSYLSFGFWPLVHFLIDFASKSKPSARMRFKFFLATLIKTLMPARKKDGIPALFQRLLCKLSIKQSHIGLNSFLKKHHYYGNTGCGVFKRGIPNYKDFCLRISIVKGNN